MTLGRENVSVAIANGSADVLRLTGLLRNNDLISHDLALGQLIPWH